jgi:two-component system cell cycle response regulator
VQGNILIVDSVATNRIMLKVKLTSACYTVVQANSVASAVLMAEIHAPELVISAMSLDDGGAADLCNILRGNPLTEQAAILVLDSGGHPGQRIAALQSGAQDVLQKPVDDMLLLGRVRSLLRAHNADAEWQMRDDTSRALGFAEPEAGFGEQGHAVFVTETKGAAHGWAVQLRASLPQKITQTTADALMPAVQAGPAPDTIVLILPAKTLAARAMLRLIATLRAHTDTRHAGILVLQTKADSDVAANALDLGADDLMSAGFDAAELALRLKALLRRKRIGEQLRATVRSGLRAAVNDPLTGLYNRRYAMPYLARMAERACEGGSVFAVMIADLDHFKRINDHFGHASGDAVLVEVADRLRQCLRTSDMIARIGGEEFLIVTPSTTLVEAQTAALRVCNAVSDSPIPLPAPHHSTKVTISIGMALGDFKAGDPLDPDTIAQELLHRADKALYAAKGRGRNQVKLGRPAA